MKRSTAILAAITLALAGLGTAHARQDDIDISRLTGSLNQLANDPGMGNYAQAEQARARLTAAFCGERLSVFERGDALRIALEARLDAALARLGPA